MWKRGTKYWRRQKDEGHHMKTYQIKKPSSGGPQRLNCQAGSVHRINLGPLQICKGYTAWSSCETSNRKSRCYLWLCWLPLDHFPLTWRPCLASLEESAPSTTTTWYTMEGWYQWEVSTFLRRKGGGTRQKVRQKAWE